MSSVLRGARVGDRLPRRVVDRARARRLDATYLVVPGHAPLKGYLDALAAASDDFAAWDGRVVVVAADDESQHRGLIVDRYGQVYAVADAPDAKRLPDPAALAEWFRFLATACPECGVLDEPALTGPTP
jgi:hypothetical protein